MLIAFIIRWIMSSLGLWVASGILGSSHLNLGNHFLTAFGAGFFLALVNLFIKPLVIILSLPAILLSLGLFMIVINGLMVLLVSKIYHPLFVSGFWTAVWAGIIIGLLNWLISQTLKDIEVLSKK